MAAPAMAMSASFHRKGRVMMPSSVNTPTKEASSVFQNSGIGKYWNTVVVLSFSEANRARKLELAERHKNQRSRHGNHISNQSPIQPFDATKSSATGFYNLACDSEAKPASV